MKRVVFSFFPFGSWIEAHPAEMLHTATFVIICHLQVCNLSPALSKWCNADIMPGVSGIMCQCYAAVVRDASPTHWLESHLASVCLITFWHTHLIFLALRLSSLPSSDCDNSLSFPVSGTYPPPSSCNFQWHACVTSECRCVWSYSFLLWCPLWNGAAFCLFTLFNTSSNSNFSLLSGLQAT